MKTHAHKQNQNKTKWMLIAALFVIAKSGNNPNVPSKAVVCLYDGTLLIQKEEQTPDTLSMDERQRCSAKWEEPDAKGWHGSKMHWKRQNCMGRKQTGGVQGWGLGRELDYAKR